ncbi:MAG: hypothetical protein ACRD03_16185 [Acidimicrobiales bacterium]
MRRYEHQPDQEWIERRYERSRDGVDDVRRTVERVGRQKGKPGVFGDAMFTVLQAVAYGWALGEPVGGLLAWLEEAAGWVDEALDRGQALDDGLAERFLWTATLAGAWPAAARVAALVPDRVEGLEASDPLSRHYLIGLAALVGGDLEGAAAAAGAMREAHADPTVPPYTIDAFAHLDEVLAAAAARDPGALSGAVARRSAAVAGKYGASIEERRNMHGLLDLRASAVVACAVAAGVVPEVSSDYVAIELLAGR